MKTQLVSIGSEAPRRFAPGLHKGKALEGCSPKIPRFAIHPHRKRRGSLAFPHRLTGHTRGSSRWRLAPALVCLVLLALAIMPTRAQGGAAEANATLQAPAELASSLSASATSDVLTFVDALFDDTDLDGAWSVAVSPDGHYVYVASYGANALLAFRRDGDTGALLLADMRRDGVGADGLSAAHGVAVSPDGRHIYVASPGDNAVSVFSQDKTYGWLTYVEMEKDGVNSVDGLLWAWSVAVSPDGRHVYVAGYLDNAVAIFDRNETTGALTYAGVVKDGVGGVDGLLAASSVAVSPDGAHVYVTGSNDDAVAVFSRHATSGALTYTGMVKDGTGGVDGLDGAWSAAVSQDGKHVYVTGQYEDAVTVFSRNVSNGALTYVETEWDGVGGVDGLDAPETVAVSPDGDHVYVVSGTDDDALAVFSRDVGSGALTFVEMKQDGVGGVDGLEGARGVAVSPDGDHVYAVSSVDDAVVAFARGEIGDDTTYVGMIEDGTGGVDGLSGARSVAVSPDGRHVYVAGAYEDAVAVFSRNGTTGALTYVEMEQDGVGGVDGLDGAWSVAVSPNGRHVYVTGLGDNAVAVFTRNVLSGALTYVGMAKDGVGGVDGLWGADSVAISLDGDHVYVTGSDDDAVAVFSRHKISGALTYVGMAKDGVGGVDGLDGAASVAVSLDGDHVYVAGFYDDAVASFSRDATTGALTFVGMVKDGAGGVDGLDNPESVTVSPDGDHVYVAASADDAVAVFRRDRASGALTFVGMVKDGVGGVDGLWGAASVAVSLDGHHVYVVGNADDAVVVFSRNGTSGALTYVGMKKDGVGGVDGLNGARSVAVSPDGHHVYATSSTFDNAVVIFGRQKRANTLTYVKTRWTIDGLDYALSVAVSPDGNHVYTTAYFDDAVAVFRRDGVTGELSYVETEWDGVGGVDGLNGAYSVAVSPDGDHVYVTGSLDDAVAVFSRDGATGALTYVEMQQDGVGGVAGLDGAHAVAVSPDGDHVYVTGLWDNAVAVFSRNKTTGALTYVETKWDGVGGVDGLNGPESIAVSPDGKHVYVTGSLDDAVAMFSRNGTTGALTYTGMVQDSVGGVDGLYHPLSVAISPNGDHVYVGGEAVAVFSRNGTTGALTYTGIKNGSTLAVTVSPDGKHVYSAHSGNDTLTVFSRDETTGALTYVEMHQDGVGGVDGLDGVRSVAVSPDSDYVYVVSEHDSAVAVFRRQFPVFLPLVLRNY